jgi:hypothetical protein
MRLSCGAKTLAAASALVLNVTRGFGSVTPIQDECHLPSMARRRRQELRLRLKAAICCQKEKLYLNLTNSVQGRFAFS